MFFKECIKTSNSIVPILHTTYFVEKAVGVEHSNFSSYVSISIGNIFHILIQNYLKFEFPSLTETTFPLFSSIVFVVVVVQVSEVCRV